MTTRNEYGVFEPTDYDEYCDWFSSQMPDWEEREKEDWFREIGYLITERDMPLGDEAGLQEIADWDVFLSLSYVDPAEREG